jgi:hypothetical protein
MGTAARKIEPTHESEAGGVVLTPEDEAELVSRIAETDEDLRTGRAITWEQFQEEREARRAG